MAKYAIDSTTLTGIADAIREKTKTTASVQTSQMAEAILAIKGGGVELDVVTASSLPATVTDGQIVVITDTTPGTVYIDTDAPASPESGDVWVTVAAEATVKLELTEESPYLRGGLTAAAQWDGNAWVYRDGYLGVDGKWEQISLSLPPIGTALNDCTWEQISAIAASGKAKDYFAVGDAKEIVLNGTVGNTTFDKLSIWAFIIGFDHNADIEGSNTIHFQIGMDAQTDGTKLCFADTAYGTAVSEDGYFDVNHPSSNTGGWESSYMRNKLLGNTNEPSAPLSGSLMAALPGELRDVMKRVTKYSDNTGGGADTASNVTTTTDYLWLLSEYEVFGVRTNANSAEQKYQKQYAYFASGNSKVFKRHDLVTTAVWWLRSPYIGAATRNCVVNTGSNASAVNAGNSYGVAPAFCV